MYFRPTSVLLVAIASIIVNSGQAQAIKPKISISSIYADDYIYFPDTSNTMRNRATAATWCKDQGAELAKVTTSKIYNILRVSLSVLGTYWIDGMDSADVSRFILDTNCTTTTKIDLSGKPIPNVNLPQSSCLAFVKGTTAANTEIRSQACATTGRVLCGYPMVGCVEEPATTAAGTL